MRKKLNLREKLANKTFSKSDVPIIVYAVVVLAMLVLFLFQDKYPLAGDFFIELFGVAFTLFIIDILLVRSKTKRWKIVHDDIDYLIARLVNRMREGLAYRCFKFVPNLSNNTTHFNEQLTLFLEENQFLTDTALSEKLSKEEFFSLDTYQYLNERATDIWDIINMKYAEFLAPDLVSNLINLHASLKDMAVYNVQYRKADRYGANSTIYKEKAVQGLLFSLRDCLKNLNKLNEDGFSESARFSNK
jgi:hypothetical protein